MLVQIKMKYPDAFHQSKVPLIRELREITGFSLKEAMDFVNSDKNYLEADLVSYKKDYIFWEVKELQSLFSLSDKFKQLAKECIDENQYAAAIDLLNLMKNNNL